MKRGSTGALALGVAIEKFPLEQPFHITGHTMTDANVVTVELEQDGHVGRGEASGVYYRQFDDVAGMVKQIEAVRARIEAGIDRESLQHLLPTGGARNAVDCALWDLDAKRTGRSAWQMAGLDAPRPLLTTMTVGANTPDKMAADALAYAGARAIKLKLTGQPVDADRVRAVRAARGDVWLGVDANQGFTRSFLETLLPVLIEARVELIEQPFKVGDEVHHQYQARQVRWPHRGAGHGERGAQAWPWRHGGQYGRHLAGDGTVVLGRSVVQCGGPGWAGIFET